MFRIGKPIETQSRLVVALAWGREGEGWGMTANGFLLQMTKSSKIRW